jgi:hypothetical protein
LNNFNNQYNLDNSLRIIRGRHESNNE